MRFSGKAVSGGVAAAVLALATPFIATWEGKENEVYLDRIAVPTVLTVCYGETDPKYAYTGAKYSDSECLDMLQRRVSGFYDRMSTMAAVDKIPVSVQAGMLELMYNIGDGQFRSSSILRLANAGNYKAACAQLDRWVNAGGKRIRGLVNRRNASEAMCLRDVK